MKIDESCVNHNAVRLISEITFGLYECVEPESERYLLPMLAEIRGICEMAQAMKEVLRE